MSMPPMPLFLLRCATGKTASDGLGEAIGNLPNTRRQPRLGTITGSVSFCKHHPTTMAVFFPKVPAPCAPALLCAALLSAVGQAWAEPPEPALAGTAIMPASPVAPTPVGPEATSPAPPPSGTTSPLIGTPGGGPDTRVSGNGDNAELTPEQTKDLWDRIRRGFKMPDLDTKRADATTRWYAGKPEYIARMTNRASMYLYHIVEEIEKRGMPTEIALLPFVESAMQPEAVSVAKAAGLWQFIPSTGKKYALEQNLWKDERLSVVDSTRAALDYLQALYNEFGDWHLALAAYNFGEGGVERALAKARSARHSTSYQDLKLPNETQFYVPNLQAIKNIVANPDRYGVKLADIANAPYFVTVTPTEDMDVATAAHLANMPLDEFRALNPEFNRPVIVGASAPSILLPTDKAESFESNLASWKASGQPLASWTTYVLQSSDTLAKVAERVGLTEAQLRSANHIPSRYHLAAGSTVLVPRDESTEDISPNFVDAPFALVPESSAQRQISYRVKRGDTLDSVAKRWHVTPDEILSWNQLRSPVLFAGQKLMLTSAPPAPAKPAAGSRKPTAKPHPAAASQAHHSDHKTAASTPPKNKHHTSNPA
jgi:membrane-bound lytic murein transglycosylase D